MTADRASASGKTARPSRLTASGRLGKRTVSASDPVRTVNGIRFTEARLAAEYPGSSYSSRRAAWSTASLLLACKAS